MHPVRIEGCTHILGKNQEEYSNLPVRIEVRDFEGLGKTAVVTSAWQPSMKELQDLMKGASVYISVLGTPAQPLFVTVGKPPD